MSNPIPMIPTPTGEFQAHFGGPPGSSDLAAECKKWEKLCGELLKERAELNSELNELRQMYDACSKTLFHRWCREFKPDDYDQAAGFTNLDERPTLLELIAELENVRE